MTGMEALLRWEHAELGFIAPPLIIALAEETPIINELGIWIVRTACLQMKEWRRAGIKGLDDITISINISPHQLDDPSFCSKVKSILLEAGLSSSSLELEITSRLLLAESRGLRDLMS